MHIRLYRKLADRESYFENFSYDNNNNTLREENLLSEECFAFH